MSWTHLKINTSQLNTYIETDIQNCIRTFKEEIDGLSSDLADLDSMWDGPSSEIFKKNFASDIEALQVEYFNLKTICDYCTNAKQTYETYEDKVKLLVDVLDI